ncbi:hypothetical protein LJR027_003802 [Terrabacter sp. LjRoot27]|uniref:hypothetical protein n=1 Tax=Terrabacter sp. LjRoot27 TaxID=3342306 RepID=UPI003ED00FEC
MDARVVTWYLGPVVLLALVVNLARWLGARRLDAFAARARRRAALGSVVGALLAYAVAQAGVDRSVASSSGEGATAHPAVPALAAVAGIIVAAVAERWAPRRSTSGPRREASLDIRRGTESVRRTRYVVGGLVLCAVGLVDDPGLGRAPRLGSRVRVLRWSAAGALVTAAGLCLTIGPQLDLPAAPRAPWDWTQSVAFSLIALGLVALVVALCSLLWDAPAVPRSRRAAESVAGNLPVEVTSR